VTTALLAWELGAGLWHATLLATLGRALEAQGVRCVFALADPVAGAAAIGPAAAQLFVAPRALTPTDALGTVREIRGFADILDLAGLGDAHTLRGLVRAWDTVLDATRPDVIVADHCPALLVAAFERLPVIEVGLGFSIPPAHLAAFPPMRPALPDADADRRVLAAITAVQAARGASAPAALPALYQSTLRCVCQFPELDPYQRVRPAENLGPIEALPAPSPAPAAPHWFAYLDGDDHRVETILDGLVQSGISGGCFIRGATVARRERLRGLGVRVSDRPLAMAEVLAEASLVVHHGGAGTIHQAAAAGRPQLVMPRHLEQAANASAIVAQGVALATAGESAAAARDAALALATEPSYTERARAWAGLVAARGRPDAAAQLAGLVRDAAARTV
jgi:rhamnosyltransferase subunit B